MASRLLTLAVWAVVLASAVFWGLRIFASRTGVPPQSQIPSRTLAMGGELRRLLGTSEKPKEDDEVTDSSDRYKLFGVVAPRGARHSPQGVALIAVGDEPPKAIRTGGAIDGETVLLAVNRHSVQLGPRGGPATTELTLPEPVPIAAPARAPVAPGARPVPMMPAGAAQVQGIHPPGAVPQPMPRPAQPQQEDEEPEED